MKTSTLKLPPQVIPQREVIDQVQASKDTALQNLESILPKKVSEAFEINGFTGALDVIQNDYSFAVWDAVDGVIALAWENIKAYESVVAIL